MDKDVTIPSRPSGIGSGLTYIGSFEALKVSFTTHRNLAFGFGGFISSMGIVVYPPLLQYLIDTLYWRGMFQVMAALYLNIVVTAYLFPGREEASPDDDVDVISDILTDIIVTERFVEYEPGDELRVYEVDVGVQDDFSDQSSSDAASQTKQDVQSIKLSADYDDNTHIASQAIEQGDLSVADSVEKEPENTNDDDTPESAKSPLKDNAPGKSTGEDDKPEMTTDEDNTPGKNTDEDNTPGKSTDEDNTPEKSTDEDNTPENYTHVTFDAGKNNTEDDVRNYDTIQIIKTKFEPNAFGVSAAIGKLIHGFLATNNRVNPAFLYIGFGILAGLLTFVFLIDISLVVLYGYVVLFSICYASRGGAVLPAMMIRLAGEDNFALALGVYSLVTAVGYLVGAPVAGWIFDSTHSYKWPFVMSAISLTSSSLILLVPCAWRTKS
ncbi:uncharacterized protein LOC124269606 [Haliotis rubra]|uniref:uncharacterized protein LOC124269606 n=1 Tax=Haliotis rubra TaxID=36100 RepID=UPI001EE5A2F4|nr:uncharacterized protein LOC124269606 [Haliotis rubra]